MYVCVYVCMCVCACIVFYVYPYNYNYMYVMCAYYRSLRRRNIVNSKDTVLC